MKKLYFETVLRRHLIKYFCSANKINLDVLVTIFRRNCLFLRLIAYLLR